MTLRMFTRAAINQVGVIRIVLLVSESVQGPSFSMVLSQLATTALSHRLPTA